MAAAHAFAFAPWLVVLLLLFYDLVYLSRCYVEQNGLKLKRPTERKKKQQAQPTTGRLDRCCVDLSVKV